MNHWLNATGKSKAEVHERKYVMLLVPQTHGWEIEV
jgi:hypothetical protein